MQKVRCDKGHSLRVINQQPKDYSGWLCDGCRCRLEKYTLGVLHCDLCKYDLCVDCQICKLQQIKKKVEDKCFKAKQKAHGANEASFPPKQKPLFSENFKYFRVLCSAAEPALASFDALATIALLLIESSSQQNS
jgi:hypothetical protein